MSRYIGKIRNRIVAGLCAGILVAAAFVLLAAGRAQAMEDPDISMAGSITLTILDKTSEDPRPVTDGELELILVAQGEIQNSRYVLEPVGIFANEDFSLDLSGKTDLSGKDVADGVYDYAMAHTASIPESHRWKTEVTDSGTASWTGLQLGLYLVHQTRNARDYQALNPFLVTVPMVQKNEAGEPMAYIYDVNATPKPETIRPEDTDEPEIPTEPQTPSEPERPIGPSPSGKTPEKLPQTGQLWWPVWILTGVGIACIGIGLIVFIYRRRASRRNP